MIDLNEERLQAGGEPMPYVPVTGSPLVHRKKFSIWKFFFILICLMFGGLWLYGKLFKASAPAQPPVTKQPTPAVSPATRPSFVPAIPVEVVKPVEKPTKKVVGVLGKFVRLDGGGVVEWRLRHAEHIARENDAKRADIVYAKSAATDGGGGNSNTANGGGFPERQQWGDGRGGFGLIPGNAHP